MTLLQLLDNIAWHSLTGPQAAWSAGRGRVRRYARMGFHDHRALTVRVLSRPT